MTLWQQVKRWSGRVSSLSLLVCAAGLAPVFAFAGPPLAMGFWLYEGEMEPSTPEAAFPWLWVLPLLVVALGFFVAEIKTGQGWMQWIVGVLGGLAIVLEITHMLALVRLAAP